MALNGGIHPKCKTEKPWEGLGMKQNTLDLKIELWSVERLVPYARNAKFNRAPKAAIGLSHPFETEAVENAPLPRHAENCLGRRGSGVQIAPPRPFLSN